jgi:hypothetical protein
MSDMTDENREERNNQETGKRGNGETAETRDAEPGTRNPEPASGNVAAPGPGADTPPDASPHPYEEILDEYPLREAAEDPVWSVRIVKGWMWFLAFSITGIVLLLILGFFYD